MQTLEALKRKMAIAEELHSIVRTMKVLAAVSIRQYEQAVKSLADYSETIELGLQIVLQHGLEPRPAIKPAAGRRVGLVIFGSDQGMCGRFNEQIAAYTLQHLTEAGSPDALILGVGQRVIGYLEQAERPIADYFAVPGTMAAITPLVQTMLIKIEGWREQQGVEQIALFYNKPVSNAAYEPHREQFWPVDPAWLEALKAKPWPSRVRPTYRMAEEALFAALIRQQLFVSLYRACLESLAGENAARLMSMQAAERNLDERLQQLKVRYNHQRQSAITEELLDIVAGFEALTVKQA
ncbi:MAG: F0F1 ATP synthase subunit gamma [Anaerolineales bacterium]|nr:F0F1 ATP synthase subunit gamma [Anaerolineales bacterium]